MARRKIVILAAGLLGALVLGAGLGGCKDLTFNGDMKGYLEYWTDTVSVASARWSASPEQQTAGGRTTVATNATITASLTISNPEGYPLESVVSHASGGPHAVEVSGPAAGTVLGLTKVTAATPTSLEVRIEPYAQVSSWESRRLEHTDFTVRLSPTRSDTAMQSPNPLVLSLRYNTPPRMPLEVVDDGQGNLGWLSSGQRWSTATGGSNSGKIFWAWPADKTAEGGCSPTDPDYAVRFYIDDGSGSSPQSSLEQGKTLERNGTLYNVYSCTPTPGGSVKVYAEDGEGVRSCPAESGRTPFTITLHSTEGTFAEAKTQIDMYKTPDSQGTLTLTGGDLDVPAPPSGKDLVGWSEKKDGDPITFPYEVTGDATLYALWEEDREWQDGINRKTGEYEKPQYSSGSYQISNPGNLLWIAQQIKTVVPFNLKLTADIVIPSGTWKPIHHPDGPSSTFDGQGHSITLDEKGGGLFEYIGYSTIKNLVLKGKIQVDTVENVGAVTGSAYETRIENVMSEVTITNLGTGKTGGLVGVFGGKHPTTNPAVPKNSFIKNCAVYANVTSKGKTGGLVGELWGLSSPGTISNSVYMGAVSGSPGGAIVGSRNKDYGSTLSNIYYCETGGLSPIGDDSSGLTTVVSKTKDEIASDATANLLNTGLQPLQWEYKQGAKYPTLKQPNP